MIGKLICIVCIGCMPMHARKHRVAVQPRSHSTHERSYERPHAYLEMQKEHVYQYEPVPFFCYFSGPIEEVSQPHISWSQAYDIYIYPHPHITDDDAMRTWCWSGIWYPQQAGVQETPRMRVTYEYQRRRKGRSGMLGSIWGGFAREQNTIYAESASQKVHVSPVPQDDIDTVGMFDTWTWRDAPHTMQAGDTREVHLDISGAGNLLRLQPPQLTTQAGMRWYHISDNMEHPVFASMRSFTYLIAPQQPGTYTIEVPAYYVFDPRDQQVRTYAPRPVTIEVQGECVDQTAAEETQLPDDDASHNDGDAEATSQEVQEPSYLRQANIPFPVFLCLFVLPILAGTGCLGVRAYRDHRHCHAHWYAVRSAYRHAYHTIRRTDDAHAIYVACANMFHAMAASTGIYENAIERHVAMYMPSAYQDWSQLWHTVTHKAFAGDDATIDEAHRKALQRWITQIYQEWRDTKVEFRV